ncbi:hypothetical protein HMSSN139_44540 [Paenibacillus sp. HMSSN-139]|nr:hypothetical protein HMSSN139_44540 [Paenibacillus sp. HMSSN-139]
MSLLEMSGVTHRFGDKELYRGASLELHAGEHMGLVGQNGAGKSTLIRMLTGEVIPDQGSIQWQPRLRLGHLDQYARISGAVSIRDYLKTAFDELYELERKMAEIYREVAVTGDESRLKLAALCQEKLDAGDFYGIDSRIDQTAMGLGIQAMGMERPMSELRRGATGPGLSWLNCCWRNRTCCCSMSRPISWTGSMWSGWPARWRHSAAHLSSSLTMLRFFRR